MKYLERIQAALRNILETDSKALIIGEDINDPYGGAFKVTKGLSTEFSDQVFQTPISEAAFTGLATGLAIGGYKPIVEIIFGDFITFISDVLINSASKFDWFSQNNYNYNLVIRTPMGGGRGYGPIHSQSLEKLFFGWPNIQLTAPNILIDPYETITNTFCHMKGVSIIIENKIDYGLKLIENVELIKKGFLNINILDDNFKTIVIDNASNDINSDIALICYGGISNLALETAFQLLLEEEITTRVIIPTLIYPLSLSHIKKAINNINNLFIIEEGYAESGWGAYLINCLANNNLLNSLNIRTIGSKMQPIPANYYDEKEHLPNIKSIIGIILENIN